MVGGRKPSTRMNKHTWRTILDKLHTAVPPSWSRRRGKADKIDNKLACLKVTNKTEDGLTSLMRDADHNKPSVQRRSPVSSSDSSQTNTEPDRIKDILYKNNKWPVGVRHCGGTRLWRGATDLDFIESPCYRLEFVETDSLEEYMGVVHVAVGGAEDIVNIRTERDSRSKSSTEHANWDGLDAGQSGDGRATWSGGVLGGRNRQRS